jgi:hypothetical protein
MLQKIHKISWQEKAKTFELHHLGKIANNKAMYIKGEILKPTWSIRDTAADLGVSPAQVHLQLELARALRVYTDLEKCATAKDAIEFLKKKKRKR